MGVRHEARAGRRLGRAAALAAAAGALLALGPAAAMDPNRPPSQGAYRLVAGFQPDPYRIPVRAGGRYDAARMVNGCAGSVATAPDIRIDYRAGRYRLTIFAESRVDTTLIVNDPSGRWFCDDDSGGAGDPSITFDKPRSGQYDVWVGVYGGGRGVPASVFLTER